MELEALKCRGWPTIADLLATLAEDPGSISLAIIVARSQYQWSSDHEYHQRRENLCGKSPHTQSVRGVSTSSCLTHVGSVLQVSGRWVSKRLGRAMNQRVGGCVGGDETFHYYQRM